MLRQNVHRSLRSDGHDECVAVGVNPCAFARIDAHCIIDVPIETGFDDWPLSRRDLRSIESCAELWDAKNIGDARPFDPARGIERAGVIECAPCNDTCTARVAISAIMTLGVVQRLLLE